MDDLSLDDIDNTRIERDGAVLARLGLMATVYLERPEAPETRAKLFACVAQYARTHADQLRWSFAPERGMRPLRGGQTVDAVLSAVEALDPATPDTLELIFHGGTEEEDASTYTIHTFAGQPGRATKLGFLSLSVPLAWAAASPPGAFPRLVMRLCTDLRPLHGYAGLGVLVSADYGAARRAGPSIYPLARRFPGLEVDMPISHLRFLGDGIKGVNWLTILSDPLVSRLGGIHELQSRLPADIPVHTYSGGILIQAGPHPQIGDVNRQLIPHHYRAVARVIRPVRADYGDSFLDPPEGDDVATTRAWLERFD